MNEIYLGCIKIRLVIYAKGHDQAHSSEGTDTITFSLHGQRCLNASAIISPSQHGTFAIFLYISKKIYTYNILRTADMKGWTVAEKKVKGDDTQLQYNLKILHLSPRPRSRDNDGIYNKHKAHVV